MCWPSQTHWRLAPEILGTFDSFPRWPTSSERSLPGIASFVFGLTDPETISSDGGPRVESQRQMNKGSILGICSFIWLPSTSFPGRDRDLGQIVRLFMAANNAHRVKLPSEKPATIIWRLITCQVSPAHLHHLPSPLLPVCFCCVAYRRGSIAAPARRREEKSRETWRWRRRRADLTNW